MKLKKPRLDKWLNLSCILLGNVTFVLSVKLFVLPADLISCGTTGLGLIVSDLTNIPLSGFILVFNLCMLAVGWWGFGRRFLMTTVFSSFFYPIGLAVLDHLLGEVRITQNILLNVLFAGMGLGMSLGLVVRGGASTGGMDIPPLLLKKFFHIPVSVSLMVSDFMIMLGQMAFHPVEDLLYGILLLITVSVTLNKTLLFGTSRTEVKIISSRSSQIRDAILSQIDRGCTVLHGEGGYRREDAEVILSVVSNYELPRIERLARDIDPTCFMIINRVSEVWGRGFSYDKYDTP